MYNNTIIKLIEEIYLNPGIHKRGLSKKLDLGMPSIVYALKKIDNLLIKKRSGNQIRLFLDYSKKDIVPLLSQVEHNRFYKLPNKIKIAIEEFISELNEKPLLVILFGSYATKKYNISSDIDILLVYQKLENTKTIEKIANKISMRTNTNLNPIYLDYVSFSKDFRDTTKKFFKKLKENKIILMGIEWWRLLKNEQT